MTPIKRYGSGYKPRSCIEYTFQVKADDGKMVLEVFQLKRENE